MIKITQRISHFYDKIKVEDSHKIM